MSDRETINKEKNDSKFSDDGLSYDISEEENNFFERMHQTPQKRAKKRKKKNKKKHKKRRTEDADVKKDQIARFASFSNEREREE